MKKKELKVKESHIFLNFVKFNIASIVINVLEINL